MKAYCTRGRRAPQPSGGRRHAKIAPPRAFLRGRRAGTGDRTMPELAAELAAITGPKVEPAALARGFSRTGYRGKNNAADEPTSLRDLY